MPAEKFAELKAFPNYRISDSGRVINKTNGHEIRPYKSGEGFLQVRLSNAKETRTFTLHRLVAYLFMKDYEPDKRLKFKNEDRKDCNVRNLVHSSQGVRPMERDFE